MLWVIFAANAAMRPEPLEGLPEKPARDPGTELRHKKWRVVALRMPISLSLFCVLGHNVIEVTTQRHQPRLVEFRVPNDDHGFLQGDIRQIQGESFADSWPRPIQQEQYRSKGVRFHHTFRTILLLLY